MKIENYTAYITGLRGSEEARVLNLGAVVEFSLDTRIIT